MTNPYAGTANSQSLLPMTPGYIPVIASDSSLGQVSTSVFKSMLSLMSTDIGDFTTAVDALLAPYALASALTAYATTTAINTLLAGYVPHGQTFAEEIPVLLVGTLLNQQYTLIQKMKHAGTITGFVQAAGSLITAGTYTIKINSTAVTGLNAIANTTSATESLATANNAFNIGDTVTCTFAGSVTLVTFMGQLSISRTL